MKKVISVLLAVLMLFSVMSVAAVAADEGICRCMNHIPEEGGCHCCVYCLTIDVSWLTSCAKKDTNGEGYDGSLCCAECTGIFPCDCGCDCCEENATDDDNDSFFGDLWDDDAQESFVDAFQKILKQISDVFDRIFNAIFEFLRIDGVLGND